jgi:hypothetical protein
MVISSKPTSGLGWLPVSPSFARDTEVNLWLAAARRLQRAADTQVRGWKKRQNRPTE